MNRRPGLLSQWFGKTMKRVLSWILEGVVATAVFVACFNTPGAVGLPHWTIGFSGIPIWLYLAWRLERPDVHWRPALLCVMLLAALLTVKFLVVPEAWRPAASVGIIVFVILLSSSRHRRGRGFARAEPSGSRQ